MLGWRRGGLLPVLPAEVYLEKKRGLIFSQEKDGRVLRLFEGGTDRVFSFCTPDVMVMVFAAPNSVPGTLYVVYYFSTANRYIL